MIPKTALDLSRHVGAFVPLSEWVTERYWTGRRLADRAFMEPAWYVDRLHDEGTIADSGYWLGRLYTLLARES